MSQPEQDMLRNAQDWMGSLQAKAWHATVGTYFSDKDIVSPDQNTYAIPLDNVHAALSQGGPTAYHVPMPEPLRTTPIAGAVFRCGHWHISLCSPPMSAEPRR
jgi:hypothetical protein